MLQARLLRTCYHASHSSQLAFRTYSSNKSSNEIPDFEAARQWFQTFNPSKPQSSESALPSTKIAKTEYSRASGPGGQKTNKTSSKATTAWPLHALLKYIPKALHQGLRDSTYYVSSSDTIKISCDSNRTQTENREETHRRLFAEIERIYRGTVPGVTSEGQKDKVSELRPAQVMLKRSSVLKLDRPAFARLRLECARVKASEKRERLAKQFPGNETK